MKYSVEFRSHYTLVLIFSLLLTQTSAHTADVTLASIAYLDRDEFRTDEGNEFRLIKLGHGCKLEARFFVSFENTLYSYIFKQSNLISGTEKTFRYHYDKDHEGSLLHVTDIYQHSSAQYNIDDVGVKKDFNRYKALFSNKNLKLCDDELCNR